MKAKHSILLKELMDDLNGSDQLCAAELTASDVIPILNKNGKSLRHIFDSLEERYIDGMEETMEKVRHEVQAFREKLT